MTVVSRRRRAQPLGEDLYRQNTPWFKGAVAYRLLYTLLPPGVTRRLPKWLRGALIGPGVTLPPGVELPPGTVVPPGTTFPPGWIPPQELPPGWTIPPDYQWPDDWNSGDPLPPEVVAPPGAGLPEGWSPGDPTPPGVEIPPGTEFPPGWTVGDPLPPGVIVPPPETMPPGWSPGDQLPEQVVPPPVVPPIEAPTPPPTIQPGPSGPKPPAPQPSYPAAEGIEEDDFDEPTLGDQWTEDYTTNGSSSLAAGKLTLNSGDGDFFLYGTTPNWIYQASIPGDFDVKILMPSQTGINHDYHHGGLLIWAAANHFGFIGLTWTAAGFIVSSSRKAGDSGGNAAANPGLPLYFRIARSGSTLTFYYSTNGTDWTDLTPADNYFDSADPVHIGIVANHVNQAQFSIDIDWIQNA